MNYSDQFYADRKILTQASADAVLTVLFAQMRTHMSVPERVLDVGCATGIWLAACKDKGSSVVHGIDGPWVPKARLDIEAAEFTEHNLGESMPNDAGSYDLALCIEVAEHLAAAAAESLVDYLTARADAVLFSAAIPGQGGTDHVNEQLQSYWREVFANAGYVCFDPIRQALWNDSAVNLIYRQNMLLYVRKDSALANTFAQASPAVLPVETNYELDRVHPELFSRRMQQRTLGPLLREKLKKTTLGRLQRLIR